MAARRWKVRLGWTLVGLIVLGIAVPGGLFYFGLWSPNGWLAKAYLLQGIDVSNHQGEIDWARVAGEGRIDFVYIKATEGADFRDKRFAENWKEAARHGLRRGAYHFFTMKSPGKRQAENFLATVPMDAKALPPAVDLEFFGNSKERRSVASYHRELDDFLAILRQRYGKEPVIYTDDDFASTYLQNFPVKRLWVPSYFTMPKAKLGLTWTFWQYTPRGRVPGVATYVDRNVFFGDEEDLAQLNGRLK